MNSNQKGANFERFVCRRLSLWISHGARDDLFWRSAMSGGRATLGLKQGRTRVAQTGDVTAIDPLGARFTNLFIVECKHIRDLRFDLLVSRRGGPVVPIWNKLINDCRAFKRSPFLVLQQNRTPILIATDRRGRSILGVHAENATIALPWNMVILDFKFVLSRPSPQLQ